MPGIQTPRCGTKRRRSQDPDSIGSTGNNGDAILICDSDDDVNSPAALPKTPASKKSKKEKIMWIPASMELEGRPVHVMNAHFMTRPRDTGTAVEVRVVKVNAYMFYRKTVNTKREYHIVYEYDELPPGLDLRGLVMFQGMPQPHPDHDTGSAHLRAGHYWLPAFARPAGQAFVTEREECIDRKLKMIDAFRQQYPDQDFPDALPVRIRDIRIADIMESRGYTHVRYEIPGLETQSGEIE